MTQQMQTSANPPKVPGRILVENVRASFTDGIWTASAPPNTNGERAYNMQAILPRDHPQVPQLIQLINEAAQRENKWRGEVPDGQGGMMPKWQSILTTANAAGKVFLRSGDDKPYDGYAGNLYISTRSKRPPQVLEGRRVVTQNESRIYSGCYVNLLIDVFPYTRGSNGIGAAFKGVQFLRDGEPLGGGAPANVEEFADIAEGAGVDAASEFGALMGVPAPAGGAAFDHSGDQPIAPAPSGFSI